MYYWRHFWNFLTSLYFRVLWQWIFFLRWASTMRLIVYIKEAHRHIRGIRKPLIKNEYTHQWTTLSRISSPKASSGWGTRLFYRTHQRALDEREISCIYSLDLATALKTFVSSQIEKTFGTLDDSTSEHQYLLTARVIMIKSFGHLMCPRLCLVSRLFPLFPNDVETDMFVPSKVVILAVSYHHPKMSKPIAMTIPIEMCLAENEILSEVFVLRWLCYNVGVNEYVFDSEYSIKAILMVGIDIADVELSSSQYLLLGVNTYSIKTII